MSKTIELARHLERLHINNMYKSDFYWTWDKTDEELEAIFTVADALLLFVIAVGFFIPVGIEYVETGLVPKFPTLIACGFAGLAALQSLFAGLILHNLGVKDRRDFEFRLQIVGKDTKE